MLSGFILEIIIREAIHYGKYASAHMKSSLAQHPVNNSVVDKKRVLVSGTGSNVYDWQMRCELVEYARSLGGDVVPKHV